MNQNKVLGGVLLVAGTTIGAGMLALPVVTGLAGFLPTLCLLIVYWAYMTYTAFLLLEVNLWMGENINLITMAKHTLGRYGEVISWSVYLLLLYLLTTAYLAGGGPIFALFINSITGWDIPGWVGAFPLLFIFGFFVYEGTKYVDYVNRILMIGLVAAFFGILILLVPQIEQTHLEHSIWKNTILAVSLISVSFGFHIVIPSLTTYLHRNVADLKKAIFIGSLIPLVVYIIWEFETLGTIPPNSLVKGYIEGETGVKLLGDIIATPAVNVLIQSFSFFAIITSFLGVTLSLNDFLADGFHIKKNHWGRLILFLMTFTPPILFILINPRAFLSALEFAGVYGVVILLGLLPPIMVWSGRYRKGFESTFKAPGGKLALVATIAFSLVVIMIEIGNRTGIIHHLIGSL
jgi:tyrosine-specific transport protein